MKRSSPNPPLPTVAGVRPSTQWLPIGQWKTVLEFLVQQFPRVDANTWIERMEKDEVVDELGVPLRPDSEYRPGGCVYYYRESENESLIPFEEQVLYRDEHILVVDKPHFLPVIPSGKFLRETLLVRLRQKLSLEELAPVHRLDRETAGVVLFSINETSRGRYASLFLKRRVAKVYEALAPTSQALELPLTRQSRIVRGEPFFRSQEVPGEANAETRISEIERREHHSLYKLVPVTGKKHQLRLHMAALGVPIINDTLYPQISFRVEDYFSFPLKLVARSLSFRDPVTGQTHNFESRIEL